MDLEGNHEIIASESGSGLDVVVRRMRQGDGGESIVSFCSETNSGSLRKMFCIAWIFLTSYPRLKSIAYSKWNK